MPCREKSFDQREVMMDGNKAMGFEIVRGKMK